jgi:hypothetical protein
LDVSDIYINCGSAQQKISAGPLNRKYLRVRSTKNIATCFDENSKRGGDIFCSNISTNNSTQQ